MKFDLSNRNLQKIESTILQENLEFLTSQSIDNDVVDETKIETALFDNNFLSKLDRLDIFTNLRHLSVTNNRLIEIKAISKLHYLEFVNLFNNSLTNLNAFKELKNLSWINVSGNQIKSLDPLSSNTRLEYIDASNNEITNISDLSALSELTSLNLNGNEIFELSSVPRHLNANLRSLHISNNDLADLNEVSYLVSLENLEILTIESNPCTSYLNGANYENMFDYRPFVINWCLDLQKLDGHLVNQKEYLKAEWLYSQGKGRHFKPGQNSLLIEYLSKTCPFVGHQSLLDETRLSKILEKKESYQTIVQSDNQHTDFIRNSNIIHEVSDSINPNTYEKKILPLNNDSRASNSQSDSDNKAQQAILTNLIDHINLSSSDSANIATESNFDLDTESSSPDKMDSELNRSKYNDYDSRPIKPLDMNKLNKQLSEYNELSIEELQELKARTARHIRSKTTESSVKQHQLQKPAQKSNMTRQLSFNSNQSVSSIIHKKPSLTSNTSVNTASKTTKRPPQKTDTDIIKPRSISSHATPTKQSIVTPRPKYNVQHYSPLKQPGNSPYLRQMAHTKIDTSKPAIKTNMPVTTRKISSASSARNISGANNKPVSTPKAVSAENIAAACTDNKQQHQQPAVKLDPKKAEPSPSKLNKDKLKHSEIHNRIQKQRQEMLLLKQKNLNEFRNQLKIEHEKSTKHALNESFTKYVDPDYKPETSQAILTFEDKCAVKIQSLYRGYRTRKALATKKSTIQKYTSLLNMVDFFRNKTHENARFVSLDQLHLRQIKHDHTSMVKQHETSTSQVKKALSAIASNVEENQKSQFNQSTKEAELLTENKLLKEKISILEEQYSTLERKFNTFIDAKNTADDSKITQRIEDTADETTRCSDAPRVEIHPPIRVRLQKLNEKRVALKWTHNPKNYLSEINGYNIYINGKICGKMSPNDMIASINGIQEEGEYKIYIRSFFNNIESANSNEVITRVKRKQSEQEESQELTESESKSGDSINSTDDTSTNKQNSTNESLEHQKFESSTCSSNSSSKQEEKKDFLAIIKERLSGVATRKSEEIHTSIANRLATNQPQGYGFLTDNERNKIISRKSSESSEESLCSNVNYEPFSKVSSNKLNAKQSSMPHHVENFKINESSIVSRSSIVRQSHSIEENDENSAMSEMDYLKRMNPMKDSVMHKAEKSLL